MMAMKNLRDAIQTEREEQERAEREHKERERAEWGPVEDLMSEEWEGDEQQEKDYVSSSDEEAFEHCEGLWLD
jgi:hypothetical protein